MFRLIIRVTVIAALVCGCTGSGAPPASSAAPPEAHPIGATSAPTVAQMPSASPSDWSDCGETTLQSITDDMVSAPVTLPLTRKQFATAWDKQAGDAKTGYGLGPWTTVGTSGKLTSLSAPVPTTGAEDSFWSIDYAANDMASIALAMDPGNVQYATPLVTGQLLQTMLSVFGQDPGVLRDLGVTLPLEDYSQFGDACTYFSWGTIDYWARLVLVSDRSNLYYFYIRAPSAAETQAAQARVVAKWTPQTEYAYPPLGPEAFASFAPPLSAIPDLSGNPEAWIIPMPSLVISITNPAWSTPFIGTVSPLPDGTTMYRHPADDGTPLYTLTNPFSLTQMASGVDLLTFLGSDTSLRGYPTAARMFAFLGTAANTATGEGLFYMDGTRFACSWVGGTLEKPKRGTSRQSVYPVCTELGGSS